MAQAAGSLIESLFLYNVHCTAYAYNKKNNLSLIFKLVDFLLQSMLTEQLNANLKKPMGNTATKITNYSQITKNLLFLISHKMNFIYEKYILI